MVSAELLKELYKLEWRDKPFKELMTELNRISEISAREPIYETQPALYVKFMALGDILKEIGDKNASLDSS